MRAAGSFCVWAMLLASPLVARAQGTDDPPPPPDAAPAATAEPAPDEPNVAVVATGDPEGDEDLEAEETVDESQADHAPREDYEYEREKGGVHGFQLIALRGTVTLADAVDGSEKGFGSLLANRSLIFGSTGSLSFRAGFSGGLGGGTGGFEGRLGGETAFGLQVYPAGSHALFFRAGARGEMLGNDLFYQSMLMLPDAQLGYQHMGEDHGFELGGRAGASVSGRHNVTDYRRSLGSAIAFGAFLSYGHDFLEASATWLRIDGQTDEPNSPVDVVEAWLCASTELEEPDVPASLCLDGRYGRGEVQRRGASEIGLASAAYFGIMLGIGGNTTGR